MTRFLLAMAIAIAAPAAAIAQAQVSLNSSVMVERTVASPSGKSEVKLEEPKTVTPGDKLLFSISYANQSKLAAADFVVTNPVPPAVVYSGEASPGADFSVDAGKSWGALADLKIFEANGGPRAALPSDVTHVRWRFEEPIAAGASGELSFRAVVR